MSDELKAAIEAVKRYQAGSTDLIPDSDLRALIDAAKQADAWRDVIAAAVAKLSGTIDGPLTPFQRLTLADSLGNAYEEDDVAEFMDLVGDVFDALVAALPAPELPKGT